MEDLIDTLTRGNTPGVKTVLASVAVALGLYQLVLAGIGYRWLRPGFLRERPAFGVHRASGDTIALLIVFVAIACAGVYGVEEDYGLHAGFGAALVAVLLFKVAVVRRGLGLGRALPIFGVTVFLLLCLVWATAVPGFLGGDS